MHRMFETVECNAVATDDDIAAIDPGMRRDELEKQIGKEETDALLRILAVLRQQGDVPEVTREIFHNAYFPSKRQAKHFGKWLTARGYKVFATWQVRKSRMRVEFSHVGQVTLGAIVEHQKSLPKLAGAHGGFYDGWETSVENEQPDQSEMEHKFHTRFPWHRGNIPHIPDSKLALIGRVKKEVLEEFTARLQTAEFHGLHFTTLTSIRHYVHRAMPLEGVPTKLVFRHVPSSPSCSIEKLIRVQQLFDEIASQERFQLWRDIIVHAC